VALEARSASQTFYVLNEAARLAATDPWK